MEKKVIVCARCGAQLRVPGDVPKLKVTCPKCSYIFIHTNGEPLHNTQRGNDTMNSYYSSSSGGLRHIAIRRPGHIQKTATNIIMDSKPEFVYLDGKKMGVLKTGGTVDIDIDTTSHKLKTGTPGSACVLPAGTDNYFAEFHNGTFEIGIANDPFAAALLPVILNIFRGKGFWTGCRNGTISIIMLCSAWMKQESVSAGIVPSLMASSSGRTVQTGRQSHSIRQE